MFWTAFYVLRGGGRGANGHGAAGGANGGGAGGQQSWGRSYMSDIKRMGSTLIPGESVGFPGELAGLPGEFVDFVCLADL